MGWNWTNGAQHDCCGISQCEVSVAPGVTGTHSAALTPQMVLGELIPDGFLPWSWVGMENGKLWSTRQKASDTSLFPSL